MRGEVVLSFDCRRTEGERSHYLQELVRARDVLLVGEQREAVTELYDKEHPSDHWEINHFNKMNLLTFKITYIPPLN